MTAREALRYWIEIGGATFELAELSGREAMSRPFRFEARFTVEQHAAFDPEGLVRAPAALVLARDGAPLRRIGGIVTDVSIDAGARRPPSVRVVVEPRLALARFRTDIRVFRDKSAPEIVGEVLAALGIAIEARLSAAHAPRPYCVQMRESDFDFASRLLEDEGIFYFFTDGDVMVLGDNPGAYDPIEGLRDLALSPAAGLDHEEEVVFEVGQHAALTAGTVSLSDFDPAHPRLDMEVSARVEGSEGPEHYDYPGEYAEPAEGTRKARLRAEALSCAASAIDGRSTVSRLAPGKTFRLWMTEQRELVVRAVEHAWRRSASAFENVFEALDATTTYRPPMTTAAPQLLNPMTAYVTGPAGQDIHCDEMGRVKVRFPWDRLQEADDRTSDWVPVLQDNTGHSIGIPRVGWEVLVHFLEGDPDRPVVLGRTYNGADPFPEPLPEGKTRTALQSLSSPGREGCNTVRFEDLAGSEQLLVHAERDARVSVAHDKREDVVADEGRVIGRDETIAIGSNHRAAVGGDFVLAIEGNQTWTVGKSRTRSVGGANDAHVDGNRSVTIGGSHSRRIGTDDVVQVANLSEQVGAVILEASLLDNATSSQMAMSLTVGGALVEVARKDKWESVRLARAETIGGLVFSKSGKATQLSSKSRVTTVGGVLKVMGTKGLTIEGALGVTASAALASFQGAKSVTLKVGDASVTLGEGVIKLKAGSKVALLVDEASHQAAGESTQI